MNHSGVGHLKWMAVIAGGIFAVLLLLGNPAGEALSYAVLLSCPLMMVFMMFGTGDAHRGHSGSHGQQSDDATTDSPTTDSRPVYVGSAGGHPHTGSAIGSVPQHGTGEHQH